MDIFQRIRILIFSSEELMHPSNPDLCAINELSKHADIIQIKPRAISSSESWAYEEITEDFKKIRLNSVYVCENYLRLQTEDFWQSFWMKLTKKYPGITKNQILHISSNSELSFKASKNLGLLTCLVPRNSSIGAFDAEAVGVDFMASDLFQVHEAMRQSQGKPTYYQVKAKCIHPKIAKEFLKWMRTKHADDLLRVNGCIEYHILQNTEDPTEVTNLYVFRSKSHLDDYLNKIAPGLRAEAKSIFPDNLVNFERTIFSLDNFGVSQVYDQPQ